MKILMGRPHPLMNQLGAEGNSATGSPTGTPPSGEASGQGGGNAGQAQAGTAPQGGNGAAQQQASNGQQARVFTQEEVNRIAAQAREEGRQAASKKATEGQDPGKTGQQQAQGTQQQGQQSQAAEPPDVNAIVAQQVAAALQAAGMDSFTVAARQAGYNDAQLALARAAHDAAKPDDLGKWLAEWPTQVGMTINKQQGNGMGGPTPTAASTVPRKVDDLRDDAGLIDVFSLSPEQVIAMGPTRIREEFEKVVARQKELSGAPPMPAVLRRK